MSNELREFLDKAEQLGFTVIKTDGNSHPRLRHHNGTEYSVAYSPSDIRGRRNSLADLERIAGRKLPRANAGHFTHKRQRVAVMERTEEEQQRSIKLDALVAEAESLRARLHELAQADTEAYARIREARTIIRRYEHLRRVLADSYRVIPEICAL